MVQRYLPEVREGDKRIILVDGEIAGAINRVPAPDETRSNLHVGGTAQPTTLTKRDKEICARLGPELKKRGLIFTGIDVIGDYLTEINVTSPTGIRQIAAVRRTRRRRHDLGRGGEEGEGRAAQGACAVSADPKGLGATFDAHTDAEFKTRDIEATMATMGDAPHVTHVPTMTGGNGREDGAALLRDLVHRPLAEGHGRSRRISRTVDETQVVDEVIDRASPMIAKCRPFCPACPRPGARSCSPCRGGRLQGRQDRLRAHLGTRRRCSCRSAYWISRNCR